MLHKSQITFHSAKLRHSTVVSIRAQEEEVLIYVQGKVFGAFPKKIEFIHQAAPQTVFHLHCAMMSRVFKLKTRTTKMYQNTASRLKVYSMCADPP